MMEALVAWAVAQVSERPPLPPRARRRRHARPAADARPAAAGRRKGATVAAAPRAGAPRKLFAARDITPGDAAVRLPAALLLHGGAALGDAEYGRAFAALLAEAPPGATWLDARGLLILLLVLERCRGAASAWAPYVDALPERFDDPSWWAPPDVALLRGTRLAQAVRRYADGPPEGLGALHAWLLRLEALHRQQHGGAGGTLSAALGGWGQTREAVRWARSAVWSRAFAVRGLRAGGPPGSGGAAEPAAVVALVPVLDMADHRPQLRVSWRVVDAPGAAGGEAAAQQVFEWTPLTPVPEVRPRARTRRGRSTPAAASLDGAASPTPTPLASAPLPHHAKGAELFTNYGAAKSNEELLLGFGFVLQDNPNDTFLVSIGHGSDADGDGGDPDEAWCDAAAEWQRRLRALAAGGLALEVAISAAAPLPARLLDMLLLAAVAPAWQLPRLHRDAAAWLAARAGQAQPGNEQPPPQQQQLQGQQQQEQQQGQQEQQEGAERLQQKQGDSPGLHAAAPLGQQLLVLQALQVQLATKLAGMVPAAQLLEAALEEATEQGQQAEGASNPAHARLAAVYVLSQQQALRAALVAVRREAAALLLRLAAPAACAPGPSACPAGLELGPSVRWCERCQTLSTGSTVAAGAPVLRAPLASCISGETGVQLVVRLMLAATAGEAPGSGAASYWATAWRRAQQGVEGAQHALPWWLQPQHTALVELLQDTPAGQEVLDVSDVLQAGFGELLAAQQEEAAAQHGAASEAEAVLRLVQRDPAAAFSLFCWATRLLERGAFATSGGGGDEQQLKVLVPGVEGVPQVLRELALELRLPHDGAQPGWAAVHAACDLPAGLHLADGARLAAPCSAQQLLVQRGPAALAAAAAAVQAGCTGEAGGGAAPPAPQHVYELAVCPPGNDPHRGSKLQLLAAAGLGLSQALTLPAPSPGDGDGEGGGGGAVEQLEAVLAAMAVALSDDAAALQAEVVQRVAAQQRAAVMPVTRGAAVPAGGGMLADAAAGAAPEAPAAASAPAAPREEERAREEEQAHEAHAWAQLRQQLLAAHGRAARKQLAQGLKADAAAVAAALQALDDVPPGDDASPQAAGSARGCCCAASGVAGGDGAGGGAAAASAGARVYLQGTAAVLEAWLALAKGRGSSGSAGKGRSGKGGGGKAAKKQRRAA
ncbi:Setd3 [Scenedesmus sp. PABB004]|nr:Setd3 [Scenedesmus sp. PABB004]